MYRPPASHLMCTVGTSLFHPNLSRLPAPGDHAAWLQEQPPPDRPHLSADLVAELAALRQAGDWSRLGRLLGTLPAELRLLGAEINSIHLLEERGLVIDGATIHLLHSDTDLGRQTAQILSAYYSGRCRTVCVDGLDDADARRFRSVGLRSLARELGRIIHANGEISCAVNATGGYKAQIAIAVVVGQVTGVPVYYKHERFDDIIALPPLPVSFDLSTWFRASSVLYALSREDLPSSVFDEDEIAEPVEPLIDRIDVDGSEWLGLSPLGQIFHDTFRHRFDGDRLRLLPRAARPDEKKKPRLEKAGWPGEHPEVERFLTRLIEEVPQVVACSTTYFNPDLSAATGFHLKGGEVCGVYSPRGYTVRFVVRTTSETDTHREAMVAELNDWLNRTGA
ncbi:MAG: putative CRISPR-associated protein [Actinomyces sp.]|nr:MAG: putative CRISPR-associated protein [Actinomyces sp.]